MTYDSMYWTRISNHGWSPGGPTGAVAATAGPLPGGLVSLIARVGRVGLLRWVWAEPCPDLPQRRLEAGSVADKSPEYQRFSFGTSARSASLWQIWTTAPPVAPRRGEVPGWTATVTSTPTAGCARGNAARPRVRHLTREHVALADVLAGQVTCSRPGGVPASASGRRGARHGRRPTGDRPSARGHWRRSCPHLPQRRGSRRSAERESLIFRAFIRGRSRFEAPLWQIWTRLRPNPSQEPHAPHPCDE